MTQRELANDAGKIIRYLGPESRKELVRLVANEFKKKAEGRKHPALIRQHRGRKPWRRLMAEELGVTPLTIHYWLRNDKQDTKRFGQQAYNDIGARLIRVALSLDEQKARRIVSRGLREHKKYIDSLISRWSRKRARFGITMRK